MIEMETGEIVVYAVGAWAAYSFLRYRLLQAMQSSRLEFAERGERLLANPVLSNHHRAVLEFMLEHAYSRGVLVWAILVSPFAMLVMTFNRTYREKQFALWSIDDLVVKSEFESLDEMFWRSITATSPLLVFVYRLEHELLILAASLIKLPVDVVDVAYESVFSQRQKLAHQRVHAGNANQ